MRVNAAGGISALLKRIANSSLDLSPVKRRYSLELSNLLASLIHKRGDCRPALSQVLQLDLVKKAAPKPPSDDERKLPPSWRKVPSQSRPGQFSYVHVPTGYKQAHFPERDELPEEVRPKLPPAAQLRAPGNRCTSARVGSAAVLRASAPTPFFIHDLVHARVRLPR